MNTFANRRQAYARSIVVSRRIEVAALYGAFALIGAVVLGTLSVHPF